MVTTIFNGIRVLGFEQHEKSGFTSPPSGSRAGKRGRKLNDHDPRKEFHRRSHSRYFVLASRGGALQAQLAAFCKSPEPLYSAY
jgi:hypothetical protein